MTGQLNHRIGAAGRLWAVLGLGVVLALTALFAARTVLLKDAHTERVPVLVHDGRTGYSDAALTALMADAGPGAVRIAADHDPDAAARDGQRPAGWERPESKAPPNLGLGRLAVAGVRRADGAAPDADLLDPPAKPFILKASATERAQAEKCLTAAVYYEAALEPRAGQEAVAQVVLNRLRHPGYPKSVCGVVFQGADRPGCQFSFACDGSMARPPAAWAWRNAKDVAERALDGYVMKAVGLATHYHTTWVKAWWTPTVLKVRQIGSQIFFRPIGPEGRPAAFNARYQGGEALSSRTDLIGRPQAAAPPMLLKVSTRGSVVAPRRVVQGGRLVVMPSSTLFLGSALRTGRGASRAFVPPMHAMIAMRAAASKAALAAREAPEQLAEAPAPAFTPPPGRPAPATVAVKGGFEAVASDGAPAS